MGDVARFSGRTMKFALLAMAVLGPGAARAATNAEHKMDCSVYEQQEQANVEAQRRVDPSIHAERFDTVFYNARRKSCLASVFFTKGGATYGGILDIAEMDQDVDDEIKALEFAPETSSNSRSLDLLPLLLDRTMNTFPAIKNALTEAR
jgi:hypothetical protein